MSILRSLTIGVSGLRANSEALNVTGDNIANVNTVGFKRSRGVFADVLVAAYEPIHSQGAGTRLAHVEQMWSQGGIVTSDSPTDLALSGEGFFVVAGNIQGVDGRFYTRAGQFHFDNSGTLVNLDGLRLQGYTAQPDGSMGGTVGDLQLLNGTVPGSATTQVLMSANLDSEETIRPTFDPTNTDATSNFSHSVQVYDSLGKAHDITVYYHKNASNSWDWHALVDGAELASTPPLSGPTEIGAGTLTFNGAGALDNETVTTPVSVNFLSANPGQAINFDFGTNITGEGGTGLDGTTQFAQKSAQVQLQQNGYGAGSVAGISIASDGRITGVFSNGQQRLLGQVVTAAFADNSGLDRLSNGLWIETPQSGQALIGGADSGGRGQIVAGALEQSNVDLGTEFVNLIAYQRGFQANSRVITTSDEMYGELVNIKR